MTLFGISVTDKCVARTDIADVIVGLRNMLRDDLVDAYGNPLNHETRLQTARYLLKRLERHNWPELLKDDDVG